MATLTIQDAPVSGLADVAFSPADIAGDEVAAGSGVLLLVRNDDAATKEVAVATPGTVRGLAIEDPSIIVSATGGVGAIPMVSQVFGPVASITYPGGVTSLFVAAVRLAR